MFTYIGVYSALCAAALGNYRANNAAYFLFVGVFLVWFMGFRFETGCDYFGYLHRWIYFLPPLNLSEVIQGEEAGFVLLMGSVKAFGLEYTWLNVVASLILVFCYIRFASAHHFARLVLALLFPVVIVQLGMSGIRQAIAGGFLMLAFNAFARKEKFWTVVWILAGMQFHVSVVMFLPMAFLVGKEINTVRLCGALTLLGPVAALLLADRFETYESRYIEGDVTSGGAILRYALVLMPVPFFVVYKNRLKEAYSSVYPLLKFSAILIVSLSPLIVLSSVALHRLNYYTMPLSILLCVYVGSIISSNPLKGHYMAITAYGGYSFFWFLLSRHAQSCYVPYDNTWF